MPDKPISITALCPVCGKASRFQSSAETLQLADVLTCQSCGLKLSYKFLQPRITEQQAEPPKRTKPRKKPPAKK
jgi:transcription elongation factor Elf1